MGYLNHFWRNTGGCLKEIESKILNKKFNFVKSHITDQSLTTKLRLLFKDFVSIMKQSNELHKSLLPPDDVKGMTILAKEKFRRTVKIPGIKMENKYINSKQKTWKPLLLKLERFSSIAQLDEKDPLKKTHSLILFDPGKLENSIKADTNVQNFNSLGISLDSIEKYEVNIGFDNWTVTQILSAILPEDALAVSSFSQIGHIAHLNLRDQNLPYRYLIGEVILDKYPRIKTVVNKLNNIENTYRNFEMELLAGENNFVTQAKEEKFIFEFDFSKVYWNPRLSTEHQRIIEAIPRIAVLYDVFAGVGPFAVPIGKRNRCDVFANDLNPHSFASLNKNIILNKLKTDSIETHNMDGRDFIRTVVKKDLIKRVKASYQYYQKALETNSIFPSEYEPLEDELILNTFVVMNLPALAIDFLDAFVSLLTDIPEECCDPKVLNPVLPTIYCYAFCSKEEDTKTEIKRRAEKVLYQNLPSSASVRIVRDVSPKKEMVCLSFKLCPEIVLAGKIEKSIEMDEDVGPEMKRVKYS